ncbi:MAG: 3-deoxy-7-phosphoheptulonate synthase [Gammaproteobacteria bacterium]|nr:3-deoxy-7-phosphoheptulonate synthase [Gammaproteobacteria bacterium]MDE0226684.1 3-deoxy-7-phosphoheptulonate synthase [Gammaproteobacteria bacterium]MDE0452861.1 3-deoxy-7-phosphoheptulonate synthase [Gammaproteobacteria bacterium]
MEHKTENLNVLAHEVLPSPSEIKEDLPATPEVADAVLEARRCVGNILERRDRRLLVVVGPCSIHDTDAAIEYAGRLRQIARETSESLYIVMRAYFEKPRTTVGWKGFINDPYLDDTFRIEEGIRRARELLIDITRMGLPLSTEALDPIMPQYLHDLITWSAIGARTTESQTHREMASGLSSAVGVKNGTDGSLMVAVNALKSMTRPHRFLGINPSGQVAVIHTRGNDQAHIVLRGGNTGTNYDPESIAVCETALREAGLPANIMVDCSHANSSKDHRRQPAVARAVTRQIEAGNASIIGIMLESNLAEGGQPLSANLRYGVSITDACIGWECTESLLRELAGRLSPALTKRAA